MSESATTVGALSTQERALQRHLLSTTVALKGGGGVVFPRGFLGSGYQLDEWQFDRYRASVDQSMLSPAARTRKRIMAGAMLAYIGCLLGLVFVFPRLQADPVFAPYFGLWTPLLVVLIAVGGLIATLRLLRARAMPYVRELEGVPRVSRFAFLRDRALAMFASGQVNPAALIIRIALYCGLVIFLLPADTFARDHLALRTVVGALLLLSAAKRSYFLYVYWSFRREHGHAPKLDDLQPAEAPPPTG